MDTETIRKQSKQPEFATIEAFIEDNESGEFTHEDLQVLNYRLKVPVQSIKRELEGYGLKLQLREKESKGRGFNSNSHDRWNGLGSCQSHGGGGSDQIMGFAGQKG